MNVLIVSLFALAAGLLVLGLCWKLHRRWSNRRRRVHIESTESMRAVPWPKGWRGIPRSTPDDSGDSKSGKEEP